MKLKLLILLLLTGNRILAVAGDKPDYAVSSISPALLKNANVIKRGEEIRFEILGIGKARQYHKYALTVLNENGNKYAVLQEGYDKLHTIGFIEGSLYDAAGKKIKSLKKADIEDYSGTGGSLMTDDRIKSHDFYYKIYPYTVEYEVEIKYNYTLFYPRWRPQQSAYFSVQQSKFTVVCPEDNPFRYKAFNYLAEPAVQTEKSGKSYTWEITNLPAAGEEYASADWYKLTPTVYTGPEQFEVEGYQGNMKTWQDFGKFVYALKKGKDVLPDDIKQKVHQLVDGVTDPKEKVRHLYQFMQQNTHYISVQLGIGGWQPFDAKYVAEKKYGDCKALSNYMYSLLEEAGIKSCYTLVKGGWSDQDHYFVPDFPSSQFNHAILCVPLQQDTMWLECTSQTLPAGYLGGFTANRYVLLVTEDGGKLVRTPRYKVNDNLEVRKINATVSIEGNLSAKVYTQYKGQQQDRLEQEISGLSKDKLMENLKSEIDLPTYDVNSFSYRQEKEVIPSIYESLDLVAPAYAQVSGKRLFINPNIMTRSQTRLRQEEARKSSLEFFTEFKDVDTVEIRIPDGYQPESVPKDVNIENEFGKYNSAVKVFPDKIVFYRSYEKYSGRFPPSGYDGLVKFYEQLYKADHNRVVLVKN